MRIVWLVGATPTALSKLETAFKRDPESVPTFVVRETTSVQNIPDEHLANAGTTVLLDSFSTDMKGLAGVRWLREKGFRGPLFIFGEPATEEAPHAFSEDGLTGFFAPFERVDYNFLTGLIHASVDFDGALNMNRFIMTGGRAAQETIHSLKDFNAFVQKFSAFVSRFGIEIDLLRKVLMALSLPHVKSEGGAPVIEHPFTIAYGMDPFKIVLASPSFSRGAGLDTMQSNYAAAIGSLSSARPAGGALFPEFHHIARATQNLILLCGSSHTADRLTPDPIQLVTTLAFPVKDQPVASPYFFSFHHVVPTEELTLEALNESAPQPVEAVAEASAGESGAVDEAPAVRDLGGEAVPAPHEAPAEHEAFVQEEDLSSLLAEPKLVGDAPQFTSDEGDLAQGGFDLSAVGGGETMIEGEGIHEVREDSGVSNEVVAALQLKIEELTVENANLRRTSEAMGQDIRRLMKERRQPTTDRELRDSNTRLQEQNQQLSLEKVKALELIATREKQIELMKVQIETIKKEKVAA